MAHVSVVAPHEREEISYRESIITVYFFYFGTSWYLFRRTEQIFNADADARSNFLLVRRSNGSPTRGGKIQFVSLLLL